MTAPKPRAELLLLGLVPERATTGFMFYKYERHDVIAFDDIIVFAEHDSGYITVAPKRLLPATTFQTQNFDEALAILSEYLEERLQVKP